MPIRNLALAAIVLLSAAPSFAVPRLCNADNPHGVIYVKAGVISTGMLFDLTIFRNERDGSLESPQMIVDRNLTNARVIKVGSEWLDKHLHAAIYFCLK